MMSAGFLGSKNSHLHLGQEIKGFGSRKEPWKSFLETRTWRVNRSALRQAAP